MATTRSARDIKSSVHPCIFPVVNYSQLGNEKVDLDSSFHLLGQVTAISAPMSDERLFYLFVIFALALNETSSRVLGRCDE